MRKLFVILLIFLLLMPAVVIASAETDFSDLNHWARNYVLNLTESGVFQGYPDGTFKPDNQITIAEFIKIVTVALGEEIQPAPGAQWYLPYVERAIELGFVAEGEFPDVAYNLPITRAEMAKIVALAAELERKPDPRGDIYQQYKLTTITDVSDIPARQKVPGSSEIEYYSDYVIAAYESGIITGYPDNTFKPRRPATRAEASVIINRLIDPDREIEINPVALVERDPSFIEPVISVHNDLYGHEFMSVYIENMVQYTDEYLFKVESPSHPFLTYREQPGGDGKMYLRQSLDYWKEKEVHRYGNREMFLYGPIFRLLRVYYTTREIRANHEFAEGEKIEYKVTIKKGDREKVYYTDGYIRTGVRP